VQNPCKRPTPIYDFLLGVLTTVAVPLVATRILVAMELVTIRNPVMNASTAIATVVFVCASLGLGWRRSVLRSRTERGELIARIDELEKRVAETENAAWWGTPAQEADAERTVELEPTVVPFRHRRSS
jgi:hypothetical protein